MNKIYYIITLCIFIISCGKEDTLAPTGARDDYFTIHPMPPIPNLYYVEIFTKLTGCIYSSTILYATNKEVQMQTEHLTGSRKSSTWDTP